MHNLVIAGNLGRDPDLRYTPDGTPVATFSVADNRRWNRPDGSAGEQVTWFRVTAWRRLAEVCAEHLSKGRSVVVQGRLQADDTGSPKVWTGQDGQPRASFEVEAASVEFLGSGQRDDAQGEQRDRGFGPGAGIPPLEGPAADDLDEIPF
jgi:single-strand DNA-binding protein